MNAKIAVIAILLAAYPACVGQSKSPTQTAVVDEFTDNGDGTVMDKRSGLMWQKGDDGKQRNWADSAAYCSSLSLGGHSDWRLPSLGNLLSLWKDAGQTVEIKKKYFPDMRVTEELYSGVVAPYWSSDPGADNSAGFVSFNDGGAHLGTKDFFSFYSRCVRLGK